jgi:hypothetical protein
VRIEALGKSNRKAMSVNWKGLYLLFYRDNRIIWVRAIDKLAFPAKFPIRQERQS